MTAITPDPGTASYAPGHQPSVLASHAARTAANSCAYFADRVPRGARVLDLGCGPGSITVTHSRASSRMIRWMVPASLRKVSPKRD